MVKPVGVSGIIAHSAPKFGKHSLVKILYIVRQCKTLISGFVIVVIRGLLVNVRTRIVVRVCELVKIAAYSPMKIRAIATLFPF